jgi:hypothetical protein
MGKGRKGRSPDEIRRDRAEIARLYLQRWTQAEIGQRLGLSRQQVGYDLNTVREEWLQSSLVDFNARKAEELARIDRLERVYWDAWEASGKEKETTTSEQVSKGGGGDERTKAAIRKEERTGDPRYLAGVQWCIDRRSKILGLDAPLETRLTGQDGGPIQTETSVRLTDDQRAAAVTAILARVGHASDRPDRNGSGAPP